MDGHHKTLRYEGDEDTAADYSTDLTSLHTLREGFETKAVEAFGPQVKHLRVSHTVATTPANRQPVQP